MKILVLDDSKTMLRIISNTLKRIGHSDIVTAEDGVQGLEAYHKADGKFDIILTDWNMPEMNGYEFVKKIRNINQDVPIVMITTEGGKAEVIKALKAGVNNYVVKPFTPQVLKSKLADILGEND
jgi:two-component system chemotaxis response regulator CheY